MDWENVAKAVAGIWVVTAGTTEVIGRALKVPTDYKPLLAALITAICTILCWWPLELIDFGKDPSVGTAIALFVLACFISVGVAGGHEKHIKPLAKLARRK